MSNLICITGYVEGAECAHCNRVLRHGVVTDAGIVGAQCFARKLTAPRLYNGKPDRVTADTVVYLAKRARNPARYGLHAHHFEFPAA
jgi:hypothetical protein